ncbi:hypothetical protein FRC02_000621 [Tulasnella sp. 418]|nr:hypothetical protein FRC02_000621 [Tulasnella sp. 418]
MASHDESLAAIPSARELELENLLRDREEQIISLTNDIKRLRKYLPQQPQLTSNDQVTIPPSALALLAPLVTRRHTQSSYSSTSSTSGGLGVSNTVTGALTARLSSLQQENDELYGLLRSSTAGRLHEEVRGLRKGVIKLESALKDSHLTIASLTSEINASSNIVKEQVVPSKPSTSSGPSTQRKRRLSRSSSRGRSRSPSRLGHSPSPSVPTRPHERHSSSQNFAETTSRSVPTGPRIHKRPRQSYEQQSSYGQATLSANWNGNGNGNGRRRSPSMSPQNTQTPLDEGDRSREDQTGSEGKYSRRSHSPASRPSQQLQRSGSTSPRRGRSPSDSPRARERNPRRHGGRESVSPGMDRRRSRSPSRLRRNRDWDREREQEMMSPRSSDQRERSSRRSPAASSTSLRNRDRSGTPSGNVPGRKNGFVRRLALPSSSAAGGLASRIR